MSSLIQPPKDTGFNAWRNLENQNSPDIREMFCSSLQSTNSYDVMHLNDFTFNKSKAFETIRRPSGGHSENLIEYGKQNSLYSDMNLPLNEETIKFDPDRFFSNDNKLPFTNVMDQINCNNIFNDGELDGFADKPTDEIDGSSSNMMSIFSSDKGNNTDVETSKLASVFSSISISESRPNQNMLNSNRKFMKYNRPPVFSGEFPKPSQSSSQQSTPEIEYLAHNLLSLSSFRSDSRTSYDEQPMRFFEPPPSSSKSSSPADLTNNDLFNPDALFSLPKWSTSSDDMTQFREPPPSLNATPLPNSGLQKDSLGEFLCEPPPLPVRPTPSPPYTPSFFPHEQKELNGTGQGGAVTQVPAPIITVITSSFPQDHRVGFPKTWAGLGQGYLSVLPIPWTLIHTDDQPPGGPWMQAFDSAKVRFVCKGCSAGWTSMRGKIAFWHRVDNEAGVAVGLLFYRVFGQKCSKCLERKYMEGLELNRFEDPMWYPEEIKKVLINVLQKIGHIYYGFPRPHLNDYRRGGKPRTPHQPDRCQACAVNLCREGISVYTRRPPPNSESSS
ncbi:uncharacterized protein LOC136026268 [Artemia franciscana]|uniref:3CxxC-type domain-containing protein n=1 Tax=Artemia franciscana TaxID=6661 RepID=A0AA88KZN6_ARTSF|nr:hypothetical protein QYM36_012183 [Artemia franciscana]